MSSLTGIAGVLVVVVSAALVFLFSFPPKGRSRRTLRPIPALQRLRRAIGLSVEDGKRLHVSLGSSGLLDPSVSSAFVGLSTLERVTQLSMVSDRPPVATSGDAPLSILSQDVLHAAYRMGNIVEQYDPDRARLAGLTPLSYAAGAMHIIHSEQVSTNVLIGHFGPEVAYLAEEADRQGAFCLAASDSLPAQAALFASAQEPLIGEELYAIPAYLQVGAYHTASLRVQDILRWGVVVILIAGSLLKLMGIL